ncbi:PQQ-binding-like beta-propeller repeat protein (plasmid) [Haloarcula salina]|uniref:outer membrane protein assembly factor BamB family protein n=1 Tax=Haloarcula salina TaxID=1429914 RepID=UPI003C6EEC31
MITESNWPRFQSDSTNTGHVADITAVPRDPDVYWKFYVQSSSPVIANGSLFTGEYTPERSVISRDAATGRIEWTKRLSGGAMGTPSVIGETLLMQTYATLFAFDCQTGDQLWKSSIGRGPPGCPVALDGVAYLANGAFQEWPTEVFAFDIGTGEEQWRTTLDVGESNLEGSVAVDDDYVFIVDGSLIALDTADGSEAWRKDFDTSANTTPSVSDGTVYVTDTGGTLHAIKREDGTERWTASVGEPEEGSAVAVTAEEVYVGTKSGLHSFTINGDSQWDFNLNHSTSPTVDEETVYVGEQGYEDRALYAVAREDGKELWRYETDRKKASDTVTGGLRSPPTLVKDGVYIVAADGIHALGR